METSFFESAVRAAPVSLILRPLSAFYGAAVAADRALARPVRAELPVISVGNITWGGSGKTPAVIKLALDLLAAGKKPAVLSRGYRRRSGDNMSRPLLVSDGRTIKSGVLESGDEPYMVARKASGVAVISGKDRAGGARLAASAAICAQALILDDGFQHWGMARDLDIVCVNARNPFGNGRLIPSGILREKPRALARAGLVLITHADEVPPDDLAALEKKIVSLSAAPVVLSRHAPDGVKNVFTGEALPERPTAEAVAGFSGIGDADGFETSLRKLFPGLKRHLAFGDHKRYSGRELQTLSSALPDSIFVTTLKDAVKFAHFTELPRERFYYLDMKLEIIRGEELWQEKLRPLF